MIIQKEIIEQRLWAALEMDEFGKSLVDADQVSPIMFGTGHTVNSCNQCDNSHSSCTAGEANCNPRIIPNISNVKELRMTS